MPRRKSVNIIRDVGVDPKYGQENIQKFINVIMSRGKKNTARRVVYRAFEIIAKKFSNNYDEAIEIFNKALRNCMPAVEIRSRRVGGSVYQVPIEVKDHRSRALAFRAIKQASNERKGEDFSIKLADELIDAAFGKGGGVKIKLEKHKMAEANRAFAHYVW